MQRKINIFSSLDWPLIIIYFVLVLAGWLNIYAAVYNEAHQSIFDVSQRYGKQLIWIIAAFVLAATILLINENFFSLFGYFIYGLALLSLIIVLIFGKEINGARSWFVFGNFHLQPSEFAKIATSLALAKYMSTYNFALYKRKNLLTTITIITLPALLILFQPDMGSVLVYAAFLIVLYREGLSPVVPVLAISFSILFIITLIYSQLSVLIILIVVAIAIYFMLSRSVKNIAYALLILGVCYFTLFILNKFTITDIKRWQLLLGSIGITIAFVWALAVKYKLQYVIMTSLILAGSVAFTFSVNYVFNNFLSAHQQKRINVLLGVEEDPQGAGYNIKQSKIAIGSGGFAGKGFLQGTQTKYKFVPEQSTDFIFCTVGEEWGFVGTSVVIFSFLFLLLRIIQIAERQKSSFNRIFAYCVLSVFFIHVTINIGMTIGLFPVIGIPLPFFSYGGSSLWSFTILLFILIRLDSLRMYQMSRL